MQTDLTHLRRRILEIAVKSDEGHIPSSYSVLEIIWALHNQIMSPDDRFLLSKGHAALALYVVLEELGRIPAKAMENFCQPGSVLLGHPERMEEWGVEATTGSLGHGLPMACGLAYAMKLQGEGRVFCLIGDSEAEEGSIWEAAHIATRHKLSNLVLLIDANKTSPNQIDGPPWQASLGEKFAAFGWFVSRVNGHNVSSIKRACAARGGDKPFVVICDTVKGCGVKAMAQDPQAWHHRVPTREEAMGWL